MHRHPSPGRRARLLRGEPGRVVATLSDPGSEVELTPPEEKVTVEAGAPPAEIEAFRARCR